MKKKVFVILAALCAAFLFSACSDSPSEAVEKHFRRLQNMTPEDVKADLVAQADVIYEKRYTYYNEIDETVETEEEARELAAADKEKYLKSLEDWDEDSLIREARNRSETYAFATMKIVSEEIRGNEAFVKAVITFRGNITEDMEYKLKKNSDGDWIVQPEEKEETPAGNNEESDEESDEEAEE